MNEQKIKQLIQQEVQKQLSLNNPTLTKTLDRYVSRKTYLLPKVVPHFHNGIDNVKIDKQNLSGNKINTGTITFYQKTTYNIAVNFKPQSVWFYGIVVDSLTAPTVRAQVIGNALLGGAFYSAPATTTSVGLGTAQDIAQSCTYILMGNPVNGTAVTSVDFVHQTYTTGTIVSNTVRALVDQTHIVDVEYGGTIYARATILPSPNGGGITVSIDNLASGYSIVGNFVIE
jgi:hypothetical protein